MFTFFLNPVFQWNSFPSLMILRKSSVHPQKRTSHAYSPFWLYLIQRSRMIISGCFEVLKDEIKEYRIKSSLNAKSKLLKLSKISNIKFLPSDCRSSFQAGGFSISYFICFMFGRGETNPMNQHPTLFTFIFCILVHVCRKTWSFYTETDWFHSKAEKIKPVVLSLQQKVWKH